MRRSRSAGSEEEVEEFEGRKRVAIYPHLPSATTDVLKSPAAHLFFSSFTSAPLAKPFSSSLLATSTSNLTHTHTKKKLPWGLPPAAHQGELFRTASLRDPTNETPNRSTSRLSPSSSSAPQSSLSSSSSSSSSPLSSIHPRLERKRIRTSGGRLKSLALAAEENSAGSWRRDFFFLYFVLFILFSFRNLVAWFSYLSQYIFTYLLWKWIPLQLLKKKSCKYLVNIYKEDLWCRCSHWRTCSVE